MALGALARGSAVGALAVVALAAVSIDLVRGPYADRRGTVVEIVDGDTVVVAVGERRETVRLLGVDTPETVHPSRPVECFGPEASGFTRAALLHREVLLELDARDRDRYGRLLAYVIVDGDRFNDRLLAEGYARLLVIEPHLRHAGSMLDAELGARAAGLGLWGACDG